MTRKRALKVMFLVTEDWYYCFHRLPVALCCAIWACRST